MADNYVILDGLGNSRNFKATENNEVLTTHHYIDGTFSSITVDADITQKIIVTTAGSPVQGPSKTNDGGWILKASPLNSGVARYMFHGQSASNKGFPLSSGDICLFNGSNLSQLDFDADTDGSIIWATKC
jgi:hypothetical protein